MKSETSMDCKAVKCDATADFCCKIESVSCSEPVSVIRPTSEREVKPQAYKETLFGNLLA